MGGYHFVQIIFLPRRKNLVDQLYGRSVAHLIPCCMLHGVSMCAVLILHVQTYGVCEPETVEAEVAITEDIATPEPVTETTEEPAAEAPTCDQVPAEEVVTETLVESVEEVVAEIPEPEPETEAVAGPAAPAEDEDDEAEIEVLAEPVAVTEVPR